MIEWTCKEGVIYSRVMRGEWERNGTLIGMLQEGAFTSNDVKFINYWSGPPTIQPILEVGQVIGGFSVMARVFVTRSLGDEDWVYYVWQEEYSMYSMLTQSYIREEISLYTDWVVGINNDTLEVELTRAYMGCQQAVNCAHRVELYPDFNMRRGVCERELIRRKQGGEW